MIILSKSGLEEKNRSFRVAFICACNHDLQALPVLLASRIKFVFLSCRDACNIIYHNINFKLFSKVRCYGGYYCTCYTVYIIIISSLPNRIPDDHYGP